MSNVANLSAYQGKGWRARTSSLESEIKKRNGTWSSMRVDSEYKTLKDVLLYCPGREMADVKHPNAVQHIARIRPDKIIGPDAGDMLNSIGMLNVGHFSAGTIEQNVF